MKLNFGHNTNRSARKGSDNDRHVINNRWRSKMVVLPVSVLPECFISLTMAKKVPTY